MAGSTNTREALEKEFARWNGWPNPPRPLQTYWYDEHALFDRVVELTERLASVEADWDSACRMVAEMHAAAVGEITGPQRRVVEDVADVRERAIRAEAILAALREPSEAVVKHATQAAYESELVVWENMTDAFHHQAMKYARATIRAAVAAAEQHALHDEGLARIGQRNAALFRRSDEEGQGDDR